MQRFVVTFHPVGIGPELPLGLFPAKNYDGAKIGVEQKLGELGFPRGTIVTNGPVILYEGIGHVTVLPIHEFESGGNRSNLNRVRRIFGLAPRR